jgi:hypothetical protein
MKHYTVNSLVTTVGQQQKELLMRTHGNNGYKKVLHFEAGTCQILLTICYRKSKGLFVSNLMLYSCKILYLLIVSF